MQISLGEMVGLALLLLDKRFFNQWGNAFLGVDTDTVAGRKLQCARV